MSVPENPRNPAPRFGIRWLEQLAAGVLLLNLVALVWMIAAAYFPTAVGAVGSESEVIGIIVLLLAALGLVSIVALLHTRK